MRAGYRTCFHALYDKNQTVLIQTIQFSISHLFALSLNVKQFYLTHGWDPIRCYDSGPEWTQEQWEWKSTPHSPKLKDWNLTIWLHTVTSWTFNSGMSHPSAGMQSVYSTAPASLALWVGRLVGNLGVFYYTWLFLMVKVFCFWCSINYSRSTF